MAKSLYQLEKQVREDREVYPEAAQTAAANSFGALLVGSGTMRIANVASVPATIPAAGVTLFDTTRKVLIYSDGSSMFLCTTGSEA